MYLDPLTLKWNITRCDWHWKLCEEWSIGWLPTNAPFPTMASKSCDTELWKEMWMRDRLSAACIYLSDCATLSLYLCCFQWISWINMFYNDHWNELGKYHTSNEWLWKLCEEWGICWLPANTPLPTMVSNVILYQGVKSDFHVGRVRFCLYIFVWMCYTLSFMFVVLSRFHYLIC